MDSPAILLLGDSYGRRNAEGGGFVLCPLYGRKSKAFMAASGSTNTVIISYLVHPSVFLFVSCFFACYKLMYHPNVGYLLDKNCQVIGWVISLRGQFTVNDSC
jgi:hypothetical protein